METHIIIECGLQMLTKILATKIKTVLHSIINPYQKGFVPDGYIGKNIIEICFIIDKIETENNLGLLVSVDLYKAFDT